MHSPWTGRDEFGKDWHPQRSPGGPGASILLLSGRADVTVGIHSGVSSPSALPDSDTARLKASQQVDQKVL